MAKQLAFGQDNLTIWIDKQARDCKFDTEDRPVESNNPFTVYFYLRIEYSHCSFLLKASTIEISVHALYLQPVTNQERSKDKALSKRVSVINKSSLHSSTATNKRTLLSRLQLKMYFATLIAIAASPCALAIEVDNSVVDAAIYKKLEALHSNPDIEDILELATFGKTFKSRPGLYGRLQHLEEANGIQSHMQGGAMATEADRLKHVASKLPLKSLLTALKEMETVKRGTAFVNLKNYRKGADEFTAAIELVPSDYLAYLGRGKALFLLNNYSSAVEDYSKGFELSPEDAAAERARHIFDLADFATACARTKDLKRSAELFDRIANDNYNCFAVFGIDPDGHVKKGRDYLSIGEYSKSTKEFQRARSCKQYLDHLPHSYAASDLEQRVEALESNQ